MHVLLSCLLISTAYVAPFYFHRRFSRSHSTTIFFRSVSTFAVCLVAWLPLAFAVAKKYDGQVTTSWTRLACPASHPPNAFRQTHHVTGQLYLPCQIYVADAGQSSLQSEARHCVQIKI